MKILKEITKINDNNIETELNTLADKLVKKLKSELSFEASFKSSQNRDGGISCYITIHSNSNKCLNYYNFPEIRLSDHHRSVNYPFFGLDFSLIFDINYIFNKIKILFDKIKNNFEKSLDEAKKFLNKNKNLIENAKKINEFGTVSFNKGILKEAGFDPDNFGKNNKLFQDIIKGYVNIEDLI
jgi:hypothetical protein